MSGWAGQMIGRVSNQRLPALQMELMSTVIMAAQRLSTVTPRTTMIQRKRIPSGCEFMLLVFVVAAVVARRTNGRGTKADQGGLLLAFESTTVVLSHLVKPAPDNTEELRHFFRKQFGIRIQHLSDAHSHVHVV